MILSKTVEITISNNGAYYRARGYGECKQRDVITVRIEDLPPGCNKHVECQCAKCSKIFMRQLQLLKKSEVKTGEHYCRPCSYVSRVENTDYTPTIASTRSRTGENHQNWRPDKSLFSEYRRKVGRVVSRQDLSSLENFEKKRGLCGVPGAYQLDHIIPQRVGFDLGISPDIIGNIMNLQFIPWEENRKKSTNVDEETINEILVAVRSSATFTEIAG